MIESTVKYWMYIEAWHWERSCYEELKLDRSMKFSLFEILINEFVLIR